MVKLLSITIKLLSVTSLTDDNYCNQMVIVKFVPYGNYRLRFVGNGNDPILKLPISSNERGLIGNITVLLAPLLLPFTDSITVYSRIELLNQTPFIGKSSYLV
jgi:hypothetical protein